MDLSSGEEDYGSREPGVHRATDRRRPVGEEERCPHCGARSSGEPLANPRHETFAQALAEGQSATEAYVAAGYKPDRHHAARLATNGHIRARVAAFQAVNARKVFLRVEDIVRQLEIDRLLAHQRRQAGAAVSASMAMAKVLGLIVDRSVQTIKRIDQMNEAELRALLGLGPDDPVPERPPCWP